MPLSSFKPLSILLLILGIISLLGYIYKHIYDSGAASIQMKWDKSKIEWKNKEIEQQKKFDQLFQAKQQQNESLTQVIIQQNTDRENRYNDIQKELNKSNANLSACRINTASLLELQRAANRTIRTNSASTAIQQPTREFTNTESGININCRDLSVTSVLWAQLYFQAKDQADGWKKWFSNNFLNDNGKSYIIDK